MKTALLIAIHSLFFVLKAEASFPFRLPPSNLTRCSTSGWDFSRVKGEGAFQLEKTEAGCVAKFTIAPGDDQIHSGWRAEIEDPLRLKLDSYTTYEFRTYLPDALDGKNIPNIVFAQWHDNKKPTSKIPFQRPPFSLRLRDGNIVMPLFNDAIYAQQGMTGAGKILFSERARFNTWIQWRIRALWTAKNNGFLEIWMDGKKVVSYRGPTTYQDDWTSPYFKLGIYTTHAFNKRLWLYHTSYRRTHN